MNQDVNEPIVPPKKLPLRRILKWAIAALLVLLLVPAAVGGFLFASDYGVEATVTKKQCAVAPPTVTVLTKSFDLEHTTEIPPASCSILGQGNFVVYHVRSSHTTVYESEGGRCLYDSETGHLCGAESGFGIPGGF